MKHADTLNTLPCDAGPLIPHQPPMLLVSRLIEKADDSIEGSVSIIEAVVPHTGPFIDNGHLLPEYYVEVMAQAIASSDGYPVNIICPSTSSGVNKVLIVGRPSMKI